MTALLEVETERLAGGLEHPEGPAFLPDGRIVFVNTFSSEVAVWDAAGGLGTYARTGGTPAACAVAADGRVYVTQAGPTLSTWIAAEPQPPSIQRIDPDGTVETVCVEVDGIGLEGPNDLAFGADGRLYFTDPGRWDTGSRPDPGRIFAIDATGRGELIAELDHVYPNGIVADPDGAMVWGHSYTREIWRWRSGSGAESICTLPEGHTPDGMKLDAEGRYWITAVEAAGIDVVDRDGRIVAFVPTGADTLPLNCVFGGSSLYVTENGPVGDSLPTTEGWLLRLDAGVEGAPLFGGSAEHGFG